MEPLDPPSHSPLELRLRLVFLTYCMSNLLNCWLDNTGYLNLISIIFMFIIRYFIFWENGKSTWQKWGPWVSPRPVTSRASQWSKQVLARATAWIKFLLFLSLFYYFFLSFIVCCTFLNWFCLLYTHPCTTTLDRVKFNVVAYLRHSKKKKFHID